MRKNRNGFNYTFNGMKYNVYFQQINNKVVICYIKNKVGVIVSAKAKCNFKDGDTFDLEIGRSLAFEKALGKLIKIGLVDITNSYLRAFNNIKKLRNGLHFKFNKQKGSTMLYDINNLYPYLISLKFQIKEIISKWF
jgi:hypothetical protein